MVLRISPRNRKYTLVILLATSLASCKVLDTIPTDWLGDEQKEQIGTAVGAIGGGVIANRLATKNKAAWAVVGALLGGYVGKQIGRHLDKQDQGRMAESTQLAMVNGDSASWENPENKTSGTAKVVNTETKPEPIKMKILKSKVKKVPPLDIIGATFKAKSNGNVRGGPGTDYKPVGKLGGGEAVNVVGKVKGKDWYMISQDGVGSGFIWVNLLEKAPEASIVKKGDVNKSDIVESQVASNRICRTIEQSVKLADGSTKQDTVKACQGPNGWEVQKAA